MTVIVNDTFSVEGQYIVASTAAPTGGTWSAATTQWGTADIQALSGGLVGVADPYGWVNSASLTAVDQTYTFEWEPKADNWIYGLLFNYSAGAGYHIVFSPSGAFIAEVTNLATSTYPTESASGSHGIAAANRTNHTGIVTWNSTTGQIDITVDGTPVTMTGDTTDLTYTSGTAGFVMRECYSSSFKAETSGGASGAPHLVGKQMTGGFFDLTGGTS